MKRSIDRVAVLGAGVMGAGIAAQLANAGLRTLLLDLPRGDPGAPPGERDGQARDALARIAGADPPYLYSPRRLRWIETGNLEDHLGRIAECDWVIEAIIEDPAAKRPLLARVDAVRRPGTVVSTNSSGLSVRALAEDRSDDFRRHWLGTHFFNPPRYTSLVELIPSPETLPEVAGTLTDLLERDLGKRVVIAKDTPNFIANRIGLFNLAHTIRLMMRDGWGVSAVDALTGPLLGRSKWATLRAADHLGLDTLARIMRRSFEALPEDEARETLRPPELIEEMVRRGWTGVKSGSGFYRYAEDGARLLELDWRRMEYVEPDPPPSIVERAGEVEELDQRMRFLIRRSDRAGRFAWELLAGLLDYSARRIPEIADDLPSVDRAVRSGLGWQLGPFETWDALGPRRLVRHFEREALPVPPLVERLLASGQSTFYLAGRGRDRVFDPATGRARAVPPRPGLVRLPGHRNDGQVVRANSSAALLDLGDGVACLEFRTRGNIIGRETLALTRQALAIVDADFAGLIIANEGEQFSRGTNLREIYAMAHARAFPEIERMVRDLQALLRSLRYSRRPVVSAPFGFALGSGCELTLASDRVQAAAESYLGLAETGVGLVPVGGGALEMLARSLECRRTPELDPFPFVEPVFRTLGGARVSTSAEEARTLLYLRESDGISMSRDRLISDAVRTVRRLAADGYHPPLSRSEILAPGDPLLSRLRTELDREEREGLLSAHDRLVGDHLARILSGGEGSGSHRVGEERFLDLECEAFLSLAGEEKTHQRMEHMLRTGKPLRN